MSDGGAGSARQVIEQLWYRARINAFAHRAAEEECEEKALNLFKKEIGSALLAILLVVLVYIFSTEVDKDAFAGFKYLTVTATCGSIIATLYSLYNSVMANYLKLDVRAARHGHLLNLYQFIAQRAREVKWPELPADDVIALLKDLERDFALLKATGSEPEDRHFDIAHGIVKKIQGEAEARIAQSFPIGVVQEAQHIGGPGDATPGSAAPSVA